MPINSVFSWIIKKRVHQIELLKQYPLETQRDVFLKNLDNGKQTEFGKTHRFDLISNQQEFREIVPLQDYESLKPFIERTIAGEEKVLWPTTTKWFAKSSGTTQDKSKFIPVTKESLEDCHYKGGKDLLGMYYTNNPDTKLYYGKHLIVGGSAQINYLTNDSYFGDLSAIIMKNLPFWCEIRRTPSKDIALMTGWEEKLEKMAHATAAEEVCIIAGVPSWTLVLLKRILQITGKNTIAEVWPRLEMFMHGGVSFTPYKRQFEDIIGNPKMNYVETYNASEGFFGIQDKSEADDMLLMLDYGIYYEFIPMEHFYDENPKTIGLEEVQLNKNYALVISTNGGLWRYVLGDTIQFTNLYPFRIKVTGRTKHFINAFGEELIVENSDKAFAVACETTSAKLNEYTGAPIFMTNENTGGHEWLVEFEQAPNDVDLFTKTFDETLKSLNSDYESKRTNDFTIRFPKIISLPSGTFYAWLKSKNKLGGQNKVPRLSNNRDIIEDIKKHSNA
ncbi:MAG: GH3 auxin-responsive promoter family protein [Bacteroidia bacterium]